MKIINSVFMALKDTFDKKGELNKTAVAATISMIYERVEAYVRDVNGVMEDMKMYIEILEHYCAELDKTLWDAIERAKEQAEEEIKKQAELAKKEPTKYIR